VACTGGGNTKMNKVLFGREETKMHYCRLGMVVHICNPSYLGGRSRRMEVQASPSKLVQRPHPKKQTKNKRTVL
jgi:hypothetical protein